MSNRRLADVSVTCILNHYLHLKDIF